MVDEVHVGSQEQARGLEQISKSVSQMEHVTQKTAASAEQSAAAGEELNAQAETLQTIVNDIMALVGTRGRAANVSAGMWLRFRKQLTKTSRPCHSELSERIPEQHQIHTKQSRRHAHS